MRACERPQPLFRSLIPSFAQAGPKVTDADGKKAYNADGFVLRFPFMVASIYSRGGLVVAGTSISVQRASFQA